MAKAKKTTTKKLTIPNVPKEKRSQTTEGIAPETKEEKVVIPRVNKVMLYASAMKEPDARAYLNEARDWCGELINEISLEINK